jgi:hypothetical protein
VLGRSNNALRKVRFGALQHRLQITWNCAINNNTPVTFDGLKDVFRERGQAQYIDHLLRIRIGPDLVKTSTRD